MRKTPSIRFSQKLSSLQNGLVMGILNLTPDSFYSPSRVNTISELGIKIHDMLENGMDILDIGGFSSRPGAKLLTEDEEWGRLEPVLTHISNEFPELTVSVDTYRSFIAKRSVLEFGVGMINDISAGTFDKNMPATIGELKVPVVLMHMLGEPGTMQANPKYENLVEDIMRFFGNRIDEFKKYGTHDIILDPGFGFGKTLEQNYHLLDKLDMIKALGFPVLVGLSRKSMIYNALNSNAAEALNGTTVLNTIARYKGADILRVHDVKEANECLRLTNLLDTRDTLTLKHS